MTGLRLAGRKGTASTVSTTDDAGKSPPSPPGSEKASHRVTSRPPGLTGGVSKPPGHSKTPSATSPLLTLTPTNSSPSSAADWNNRQSPADGPVLPFLGKGLTAGGEGEVSSFGSFEIAEGSRQRWVLMINLWQLLLM